MIKTEIGLEVEGFFVIKGTAVPPPEGASVDGSQALLEVRTQPHNNYEDLAVDLRRRIDEMDLFCKKWGGSFVRKERMSFNAENYKVCQKRINAHGGAKEIHGAEAVAIEGVPSYRNSIFDNKKNLWSLYAATHINISRMIVTPFSYETCEHCHKRNELTTVTNILTKQFLVEFYRQLAGYRHIHVEGRMIRAKPFGAELRSIPTFAEKNTPNNVFMYCESIFASIPKEIIIQG
jgi:hypothetical protein